MITLRLLKYSETEKDLIRKFFNQEHSRLSDYCKASSYEDCVWCPIKNYCEDITNTYSFLLEQERKYLNYGTKKDNSKS